LSTLRAGDCVTTAKHVQPYTCTAETMYSTNEDVKMGESEDKDKEKDKHEDEHKKREEAPTLDSVLKAISEKHDDALRTWLSDNEDIDDLDAVRELTKTSLATLLGKMNKQIVDGIFKVPAKLIDEVKQRLELYIQTAKGEKEKGKDTEYVSKGEFEMLKAELELQKQRFEISHHNFWAKWESSSTASTASTATSDSDSKKRKRNEKKTKQAEFRKAAITYHQLDEQNPRCMVTGAVAPGRAGKAAHIIPDRMAMDPKLSKYELSSADVHSTRNSLFLLAELEAAFDQMAICFYINPFTKAMHTKVLNRNVCTGQITSNYSITYEHIDNKAFVIQGTIALYLILLTKN
jgi:hypothetical protein